MRSFSLMESRMKLNYRYARSVNGRDRYVAFLSVYNCKEVSRRMKSVFLNNPAWQSTFPNRIEPSHNEWLASLMLRCDEVNTWGSGTTRATLQRIHHTKSHWQAADMICPPEELLSTLADLLAVPQTAILATTYRDELISLY